MPNCTNCGADISEVHYTAHTEGFSDGPEHPLCDACATDDSVELEHVWEKTSLQDLGEETPDGEEYVWIEKPLVYEMFERHAPDLLKTGRAPLWAVVTLDAYACTSFAWITNKSPDIILATVELNEDLKNAVTGAARIRAAAFDIMDMITTWRTDDE